MRGALCEVDDGSALLPRQRARKDVRERDAERRRLRDEPVGHRQRMEAPADRERVHRHLEPVHELLDEREVAPGRCCGCPERLRELLRLAHERQPLLTLAVGRLEDARIAKALGRGARLRQGRAELEARALDPRRREALALARLGRREQRGFRPDRMRKRQPFGDACGDRDREVDPRRDDPVDTLRRREPVDARLVLRRDDRPPVRVAEPGRGGIAVEGDHVKPPIAGGGEQPELRRARA